jgi:hypothetical protein
MSMKQHNLFVIAAYCEMTCKQVFIMGGSKLDLLHVSLMANRSMLGQATRGDMQTAGIFSSSMWQYRTLGNISSSFAKIHVNL